MTGSESVAAGSDSCWGFIGDVDYAFAEGKSAAEYYLASEAKAEKMVQDSFAL